MRANLSRWWRLALMILAIGLCTGCIQETESGSGHKFTYELWVPLSVMGGGILCLVFGGVLWAFRNAYKWTLIVLGVIGTLLGPSMFFEYATVDPQGFSIRTGIPYFTSPESVQFDDVQGVRQTKKVTRGRRGRRTTNYYYEFQLKSGQTTSVNMTGNDLRRRAKTRIDQQLTDRNIVVVDDFEP